MNPVLVLTQVSWLRRIKESNDLEVRYTQVLKPLSWASYRIFLSLYLFFFKTGIKITTIVELHLQSHKILTTNSVRQVVLLSCK
jgi:hypothetical protein